VQVPPQVWVLPVPQVRWAGVPVPVPQAPQVRWAGVQSRCC